VGKPVISCESESLLDSLLAFTEAEVEVAEMLAEVPKLWRNRMNPMNRSEKLSAGGKPLVGLSNPGWFLVGKKRFMLQKSQDSELKVVKLLTERL